MPGRRSKSSESSAGPLALDPPRCDQETTQPDEQTLRLKTSYLSAMEVFRDLTQEEIAEIERSTVMRACKAGRVFYTPGETGETLFFLKKGAVQIYRKSASGRLLVIAELPPYSVFGEMSCIGHRMYERYARTTKDSLVCTMKRADVERLLLSKPKVTLRLLELIGERMIDAEQRLEDFAFKHLTARVASFLLSEGDGVEVKGFRHQDIADRLGVFRETVTDALDGLKAASVISIKRKGIVILDRKRLENMALE